MAGATSGLVRRAAENLATAGHRMVLIGRSPDRAAGLARALPRAQIIVADLSKTTGVRRAAAEVAAGVGHVDTLVNAAGVMLPDRTTTAENVETNFAVHHLAPFSLTSELLPLLQRGDGRVVNVNSEDLNSERDYDPFLVYSNTKLANLLFTYELHRRYPNLTVVALHPGMVCTNLGRHFPRALVMMAGLMSLPLHKGAEPVVQLAAEDNIVNGAYYDGFTPVQSSPASYDLDDALRLWQITETLRGPFGVPNWEPPPRSDDPAQQDRVS